MTDETPQKNNYQFVRTTLSFSEFVDTIAKEFSLISSSPLGLPIKVATNITKGVIYAEDLIHTAKEKRRIKELLNSPQVQSLKTDTEKYEKFQTYLKVGLKEWVPDRDYPEIGYLPKKLLYDKSLGDENITKYWPEATKKDQDEYIALTLDELVTNYEVFCEHLKSI